MTMDMSNVTVRIRDLGLAAALVSCGHDMRGASRDINGRFYFIFPQTPEIDKDTDAYWADTLVVKARKCIDNTKMLKGRIYADE